MNKHEKVNYVEFPAKDLAATKDFLKLFLTGNLLIMALNILLFQMPGWMAGFLNQI